MDNESTEIDEREFLARTFEEHFAPNAFNPALVKRAKGHFEKLVAEYGARNATGPAYDAARAGVDPTILVHNALAAAIRRAAFDTAKALRERTI